MTGKPDALSYHRLWVQVGRRTRIGLLSIELVNFRLERKVLSETAAI
jgi:hypothetical protein